MSKKSLLDIEIDLVNKLDMLRKEELEESHPDFLNKLMKKMRVIFALLLSSRQNGDFEICKKYAKELTDLFPLSFRHLRLFDEEIQYFVFDCVLITSDILYFEQDEKNDDVLIDETGRKHVVPLSERRVLKLINLLETKNEAFQKVVNVQEPKKSEILGRSHIMCSRFRRMKLRYDFMMEGCPKHLDSASKYLKSHPGLKNYYLQYLFEKSSFYLEICLHFELTILAALQDDGILTHDSYAVNNMYWYERNIKIGDETFSIRGWEDRMKTHATKVISLFDKMRKLLQENKETIELHQIGFLIPFKMLHNVSKAYYYLDDMENALFFSNMVERDVINRLGQHFSYLLGSVFRTKSLIYNKLGHRKKYEKMMKLKRRHDCSGSDSTIPRERNPMSMSSRFKSMFKKLDRYLLSYYFGKCKKKVSSKKKDEEKKEEIKLKHGKSRKCSNRYCEKTEQLDEDKKKKKTTFRRCARCKSAYYCSKKCQVVHWKRSHRFDCKSPSDSRNLK